ncbi:MAG: phosphoesterase RecJ protein phosphoesterase RecJ protein [Candidatus Taylorbacteria bacterium]|nr:phosphoesterase RecJ protein phosphoesterase RecJ protein [Candidatus Taylorbacteria bacterium]
MTQKTLDAAPIILEAVRASKNILLHCHPSPDPDSVCSALAMKSALEQLGKQATIISGDSNIPAAFSHFPGFSSILQKSIGEIDLAAYDLFIAQDSGSIGMVSRKTAVVFPPTMKVVVIDHHATNTGYGHINLVDAAYPAVAQMLSDIFSVWGIVMNQEIASNLMIGLFTDTGGFRYGAMPSETFACAAELVKHVPNFNQLISTMENSNTPDTLIFQALALSSIETHFGGNLAISAVPYSAIKSKGIDIQAISGAVIANLLKSVIGWNVAVSLVEEEPNKVKLSFRTRDAAKFDVSKIAVKVGGGGHKAAAGALIEAPFEEAKKRVIDAAGQSM